MLHRLTDIFVLYPSKHEIDPEDRERFEYPLENESIEVFEQWNSSERDNPEIAILKFPGTGGRAEQSTPHPAEAWPGRSSVVWTVNGPGYGKAKGRTTMPTLAPVALAAHAAMREKFGDIPIIATGNSLGCTQCLYLGQRGFVDGLLLRNPPSLRQLIVSRFGWWNMYVMASLVALGVPRCLCTLQNAANSKIPALFVKSEKDEVVPPKQQDRVYDQYAGVKRRFVVPGAGHCEPISQEFAAAYYKEVRWLEQQVFPQQVQGVEAA